MSIPGGFRHVCNNFAGIQTVVRYTSSGILDGTFNSGGTLPGTLSIPIGDEAAGSGIALESIGK